MSLSLGTAARFLAALVLLKGIDPVACRRNRTYYRQMCADGYRRRAGAAAL